MQASILMTSGLVRVWNIVACSAPFSGSPAIEPSMSWRADTDTCAWTRTGMDMEGPADDGDMNSTDVNMDGELMCPDDHMGSCVRSSQAQHPAVQLPGKQQLSTAHDGGLYQQMAAATHVYHQGMQDLAHVVLQSRAGPNEGQQPWQQQEWQGNT